MATVDEQLQAWLSRVAEVVESIKNEADVDDCLWRIHRVSAFDDQPSAARVRLLEILGYGLRDVSYQEKVPLASGRLEPDFVIRVQGEEALVIEDKAPSLPIARGIGQIRDYFLKVDAPLGMVFNIRRAVLLINTRLPELSEFESLESGRVLEASIDRRSQMLRLLSHLAARSSRAEMLEVARSLAADRVAAIQREQNRERRKQSRQQRLSSISERVSQIKEAPPEYLVAAVIASDEELKRIRGVRPEEVRKAWKVGVSGFPMDGEIAVIGRHKGRTFEARFNPMAGTVAFADEPACTPSRAALRAIRSVSPNCETINGWDWWKHQDKTQTWLPLKSLRSAHDDQGDQG